MTGISSEACRTPISAQARGAAYGLIAQGFSYPTHELIELLCDPARWSSWPEELGKLNDAAAGQLDALRGFLADSGALSALEESYNDVFGHAVRGKCPPYELEYARGEIVQLASSLADIAGFYAAFGMEIRADADDRADHLTVEAEFMSVLCAKEKLAIEEGHAEHLDITTSAQRDFLQEHLARWLPAFAYRVQQARPQTFYGGLARFATKLIAGDCAQFKIDVGPPTLELSPTDPVQDTSISCGATGQGDELVQIDTPNAAQQ